MPIIKGKCVKAIGKNFSKASYVLAKKKKDKKNSMTHYAQMRDQKKARA